MADECSPLWPMYRREGRGLLEKAPTGTERVAEDENPTKKDPKYERKVILLGIEWNHAGRSTDGGTVLSAFNVGDVVLMQVARYNLASSLEAKWAGPFVISHVAPARCWLKNENGRRSEESVRLQRLEPYSMRKWCGRERPGGKNGPVDVAGTHC